MTTNSTGPGSAGVSYVSVSNGIQRSPFISSEFEAAWARIFGHGMVSVPMLLALPNEELLELVRLAKLNINEDWVKETLSPARAGIVVALMSAVHKQVVVVR